MSPVSTSTWLGHYRRDPIYVNGPGNETSHHVVVIMEDGETYQGPEVPLQTALRDLDSVFIND